jgi:hypothetical protein
MTPENQEPHDEPVTEDAAEIPVEYLFVAAAIAIGLSFAFGWVLIPGVVLLWLAVTAGLKKTGTGFILRNLAALLAAVVIVPIVGASWPKPAEPSGYEVCVDKGIQYFREIGSYPYLTQEPNVGRKAEEVAAERCRRSERAF